VSVEGQSIQGILVGLQEVAMTVDEWSWWSGKSGRKAIMVAESSWQSRRSGRAVQSRRSGPVARGDGFGRVRRAESLLGSGERPEQFVEELSPLSVLEAGVLSVLVPRRTLTILQLKLLLSPAPGCIVLRFLNFNTSVNCPVTLFPPR
jgi:hypothetical protein